MQKVYNVGFRIVVNETSPASHASRIQANRDAKPRGIRHRFPGRDEAFDDVRESYREIISERFLGLERRINHNEHSQMVKELEGPLEATR